VKRAAQVGIMVNWLRRQGDGSVFTSEGTTGAVRPARESDLGILAEDLHTDRQTLRTMLLDERARVWAVIADGIGYVLYTTLFSTWQGRDLVDVLKLSVFEPSQIGAAGVLLRAVTEQAARRDASSVRWQRVSAADDHVAPVFTGATQLAKLRFDLPIQIEVANEPGRTPWPCADLRAGQTDYRAILAAVALRRRLQADARSG